MIALAFIALVVHAAPDAKPDAKPAVKPAPAASGPALRVQYAPGLLNPLVVERVTTTSGVTRAFVRIAPIVISVSADAPRVIAPTHVDDTWPAKDFDAKTLTDTAPALAIVGARGEGATAGRTLDLASSPDLALGCTHDPVGARMLTSSPTQLAREVPAGCAIRVDVRNPCSDAGDGAARRALVAKLRPRYAHAGPALRIDARARDGGDGTPRALYLVESLLESDQCGCGDDDTARAASVRVVRLKLPVLPAGAKATLWIPVPRYTGALYDLVWADADKDVEDLELGGELVGLPYHEPFTSEAPEDPDTLRAFSAPEACECTCGGDEPDP